MHSAYRTLADWFDNFIHHSEFLFSVEKAASLLFIPCVVSLLGFSHSGNVVALVESSTTRNCAAVQSSIRDCRKEYPPGVSNQLQRRIMVKKGERKEMERNGKRI